MMQQNILLFAFEVLKMKQESSGTQLDERILKFLLPLLIDRCISNVKVVRQLAKDSLQVICTSMLCDTVIYGFCEQSVDARPRKANTAFRVLSACISNLSSDVQKLNLLSIEAIFLVMAKHLTTLRKAGCQQLAGDMAKFMMAQMGDGFIRLL